jgi:hypothetical protein
MKNEVAEILKAQQLSVTESRKKNTGAVQAYQRRISACRY